MEAAKCPTTEGWIKKMWHMYTVENCSTIKRNEIVSFAETRVDLDIVIHCEISQKKKNTLFQCIYVKYRKMVQIYLVTKQK